MKSNRVISCIKWPKPQTHFPIWMDQILDKISFFNQFHRNWYKAKYKNSNIISTQLLIYIKLMPLKNILIFINWYTCYNISILSMWRRNLKNGRQLIVMFWVQNNYMRHIFYFFMCECFTSQTNNVYIYLQWIRISKGTSRNGTDIFHFCSALLKFHTNSKSAHVW